MARLSSISGGSCDTEKLFQIQLSTSEMIVLSRFPMGNKFSLRSRSYPTGRPIIPYSKPYRRIPLVTIVRAHYRLADGTFHRCVKITKVVSSQCFIQERVYAYTLTIIHLVTLIKYVITIIYALHVELRIIIIGYAMRSWKH